MGVKNYQAKMTMLETSFGLVQDINEYSLTEYIQYFLYAMKADMLLFAQN